MSDITDIFARDPLDLTDENIMSVIEYFRERRHMFNAGNLKAGTTKKMKVSKEAEEIVSGLDLDKMIGDI